MAFFLPPGVDVFPHPLLADEDGLLAVGHEMDPDIMLLAYHFGIFPWNRPEDPVLWWFTHPRCVLLPDNLKVSRSMRPYFNQEKFTVSYDTAFADVILQCRHVRRKGQDETWITDGLIKTFQELHDRGYAHSVEVWDSGKLVGGLYGMALGKIFYGESMFSLVPNASKFGFITLVRRLKDEGFTLVDCQQKTQHLLSLGAQMMNGRIFFDALKNNILANHKPGKWC